MTTVVDQPILVITAFVRNVHIRRAFETVQPRPRLNFWRVIYGNCTDMAVIDWCKLFGSDRESVHWKRVVPVSARAEFRRGLLASIHVTLKTWEAYRNELTTYRDNLRLTTIRLGRKLHATIPYSTSASRRQFSITIGYCVDCALRGDIRSTWKSIVGNFLNSLS